MIIYTSFEKLGASASKSSERYKAMLESVFAKRDTHGLCTSVKFVGAHGFENCAGCQDRKLKQSENILC